MRKTDRPTVKDIKDAAKEWGYDGIVVLAISKGQLTVGAAGLTEESDKEVCEVALKIADIIGSNPNAEVEHVEAKTFQEDLEDERKNQ